MIESETWICFFPANKASDVQKTLPFRLPEEGTINVLVHINM
jgi:hypothetical protein